MIEPFWILPIFALGVLVGALSEHRTHHWRPMTNKEFLVTIIAGATSGVLLYLLFDA
jgi:hypothetical protein